MEVSEHGVFQCYAGLLLQRLEGLSVVVLPEVLQTQADGLLFTVLHRGQKEKSCFGLFRRVVGLIPKDMTL